MLLHPQYATGRFDSLSSLGARSFQLRRQSAIERRKKSGGPDRLVGAGISRGENGLAERCGFRLVSQFDCLRPVRIQGDKERRRETVATEQPN